MSTSDHHQHNHDRLNHSSSNSVVNSNNSDLNSTNGAILNAGLMTLNAGDGSDSKTPPAYELITVPLAPSSESSALWEQCFGVRLKVFCDEQKFSVADEMDKYDAISVHFLLRLVPSLEPIGTIRVCRTAVDPQPRYKLSRLAVLQPFRKYGFGRVLVQAVREWVREDGRGLWDVLHENDAGGAELGSGDSGEAAAPNADPTEGFSSELTLKTPEGPTGQKKERASTWNDRRVQVFCHAQLYVKPFYARYGYVAEGPEFDEDGAPHVKMVVTLCLDDSI